MKKTLSAHRLFDGREWHEDVLVTIEDGRVAAVEPLGDEHPEHRCVLPGMVNLHSHAFQRLMAGLAEFRTQTREDFWSWRRVMYEVAETLTPEEQGVVARHLYIELLRGGYTHTCEFHYLHHDVDGSPYGEIAEAGLQLVAAGERTGMGHTLLPVLYQRAGFAGGELSRAQRRFACDEGQYLSLLDRLDALGARTGVAFHSLRAVDTQVMARVLSERGQGPIHIHVAEQIAEVEECQAVLGQRPVALLVGQFDLDPRWCLVHATHLDDREREAIAASGAIAGLCPTTEASLGDGLFDLPAYTGAWGIGSDSQVCRSVTEELRLLEYGQRSRDRVRLVGCDDTDAHVGRWLYARALYGGAQAAGLRAGLRPGSPADLIVIDDEGLPTDLILDDYLFNGARAPRHVMVGGRWVIEDGRHPFAERAQREFSALRKRLVARL